MRTTVVALLTTLLAFGVSGRSARAADVIETISSISNYSTFSGLVAKAGLVEALRSLKACTVFIPDNAAFRRLPAGELENLQKPERKDELVKLIRHHIVTSLMRETAMDGNDFWTATWGGQRMHIDADDRAGIRIDDAKVIRVNIAAGNCVIHELNKVLSP
jgi:uncharacterized surface protein with fasciclin (FAS1) repeats